MVGEVVGDVALAADELAVVLQRRVEVFAPVAGGEAVVLVEAAGVGVIGLLAAVVPFAERAGGVAGGLERIGDGLLVEVQPFAAGRDAAHAAARMIAPGEKLGPRRRADRADVEPVEQRAVVRRANRCSAC